MTGDAKSNSNKRLTMVLRDSHSNNVNRNKNLKKVL